MEVLCWSVTHAEVHRERNWSESEAPSGGIPHQDRLVGDPVPCEPSDKSSGNQLPDELISESEAPAGDIQHQDKLVGLANLFRVSPVTNRVVINSRTNLSANSRLRQEAINSRTKLSVVQLMHQSFKSMSAVAFYGKSKRPKVNDIESVKPLARACKAQHLLSFEI